MIGQNVKIEGQVVGVVHSHPKGESTPSELDVKACEQIGFPYFIYSLLDDDWQTFEPLDWNGLLSMMITKLKN